MEVEVVQVQKLHSSVVLMVQQFQQLLPFILLLIKSKLFIVQVNYRPNTDDLTDSWTKNLHRTPVLELQ